MIKLLDLLKESLLEAKYGDVAVWPSKGAQRGVSEIEGKSFDIMIGNTDVIRKMARTPMGAAGSMTSFKGDGPLGPNFTEFKWGADTSQWDVWRNMNYLILSSRNEVHWYHGKMPGGSYGEEVKDKSGRVKSIKLNPGATGTSLPDLNVKGFGLKVYKALLLEPNVGYIVTEKGATPEVKNAIYKKLMNDPDFVWMSIGGDPYKLNYDKLAIINPETVNANEVKQKLGWSTSKSIVYSNNFPT
jgi:hypothetical protein